MLPRILDYVVSRLPSLPGEFWQVIQELAPWLLLGFLIAGVLSVLVPPATVEKHLGGRGIWPVLKAAAVGVPIPLCSCGVIPVSASLRRHGASRGATAAFLISTPQTGVDSIAVTYSLLGWVFAIFRPIAALVSGVVGGLIVNAADAKDETTPVPAPARASACTDVCCSDKPSGGRLARILGYGFITLPRDLAKSLIFGVVLAALITSMLPPHFFTTAWGGVLGSGILSILIMMAMGIPLYVCATASVPMAWAMMERGVSPGAAFAFLVTGPATNAATIAMVWKVMGRRSAVIYVGTVALSALAGALVLDYILLPAGALSVSHAAHDRACHDMAAGPFAWTVESVLKNLCAVAMVGMLGYALLKGAVKPKEEIEAEGIDTEGFELITLTIRGMTCSHCASAVERALREIGGVESAKVDLKGGTATVGGEGLDQQAMRQAVEQLGYSVREVTVSVRDDIRAGGHHEHKGIVERGE